MSLGLSNESRIGSPTRGVQFLLEGLVDDNRREDLILFAGQKKARLPCTGTGFKQRGKPMVDTLNLDARGPGSGCLRLLRMHPEEWRAPHALQRRIRRKGRLPVRSGKSALRRGHRRCGPTAPGRGPAGCPGPNRLPAMRRRAPRWSRLHPRPPRGGPARSGSDFDACALPQLKASLKASGEVQAVRDHDQDVLFGLVQIEEEGGDLVGPGTVEAAGGLITKQQGRGG